MSELRAYSYGGGVQSTALLVLAAEGKVAPGPFLFANVGDDSEHPATLDYVRTIAVPYAEAHGVELLELHRRHHRGPQRGERWTLYEHLTRRESREVPIPVRMANGAPGTRGCTGDFKIEVIERELKRRGAGEETPAVVAIGISTDEFERAAPGRDPKSPVQVRTYPLLYRSELDPHSEGLGLRRSDCAQVIRSAGLPVPPKSSCWFCPFHTLDVWRRMKAEEPELYERSVELEALLIERRARLGKDPVYFTRFGRPLPDVCVGTQHGLDLVDEDEPDGCDSGYCMT